MGYINKREQQNLKWFAIGVITGSMISTALYLLVQLEN